MLKCKWGGCEVGGSAKLIIILHVIQWHYNSPQLPLDLLLNFQFRLHNWSGLILFYRSIHHVLIKLFSRTFLFLPLFFFQDFPFPFHKYFLTKSMIIQI